jgi:hypothetical protein
MRRLCGLLFSRQHGLTQILLMLFLLSIPMLGIATDASARRGEAIAKFLDAQGRLHMPPGYSGSLNPEGYRMRTEAGQAPTFVADTVRTPQLNGGQWTGFGGLRNGCNGDIFAMARLPNGNLVVAGSFSVCTNIVANNIAVYAPSSNTWTSLGSGRNNGVNKEVYALAVSGNDIYAGGQFTQAGGESAQRIARWNGNVWANLDGLMGEGVNSTVYALTVSGDQLYVGGAFTQAGGVEVNRVANWTGSEWASLGVGASNGVNSSVNAIAVAGSNIYVGGYFTEAGGEPANYVARWNGSVWESLGSGIGDGINLSVVQALAVSGGDVYVGGVFARAGDVAVNNIARWSGSNWSSVGAGMENGVDSAVNALAVVNNDLYVGGFFTYAGSLQARQVARWNGSAWASLSNGISMAGAVYPAIFAMAVSGDGLCVGGAFLKMGGIAANNVASWDGNTWTSLGSGSGNGLNSEVKALTVMGSDLIVGGYFTHTGGAPANRLGRWTNGGWAGVGTTVLEQAAIVRALAVHDGDLYIGGYFQQAGGTPAKSVAHWNGSAWTALGDGINGVVISLAVSGDEVYVGGAFSQAGNVLANNVARWNGSTWSSLGNNSSNGVDADVLALAVSGSNLYVGGHFTHAGNAAANHVARWDGKTWNSLGINGENGVSNYVNALVIADSNLYVGGFFSHAGGVLVNNIARWNGSVWSSLDSGIGDGFNYSYVNALAASGSDVYVGGYFAQASSIATKNVAHWNGSTWASLGDGINDVSEYRFVNALAISGKDLYIGGLFGQADGQTSSNIIKWTPSDSFFSNGFEGN